MMGWQWHQLDHVQIICTSLQTDNEASTQWLVPFKRWRSCGVHGERGARTYSGGSWVGAEPQWDPGAKPLVRGPPKAGGILISNG